MTFHIVALAWVLFRAESFSAAWAVLARLGSFGPAPAATPLLVGVLVAVAVLHYAPTGWSQRAVAVFRRAGPAVQTAALGSLLLVVDLLGPEGIPPFIYTRF